MTMPTIFARALTPEPEETETLPHPLAQAMELQDRFVRYHQGHPFVPGALCIQKPGLNVLKQEAGEVVFIFWRWLDTNCALDQRRARRMIRATSYPNFDCLVARVRSSHLLFMVMDSAALEPYVPNELLPVDSELVSDEA